METRSLLLASILLLGWNTPAIADRDPKVVRERRDRNTSILAQTP